MIPFVQPPASSECKAPYNHSIIHVSIDSRRHDQMRVLVEGFQDTLRRCAPLRPVCVMSFS